MARVPWLSPNRAGRLAMFTNVKAKIADYATALGLTPAAVARIILICDTFIAVDAYVESCKATMEATIEWRDAIYEDETNKNDAGPPPGFASFVVPAGMFYGIFDEFRRSVDQWKSASGYTLAIGEDLMIVGNEAPPVPESISPALTIESRPGYVLRISGKMKGMSAVRVEWQAKGAANFAMIGVFPTLPGEVTITPGTPGDPISGRIRAIFMQKNELFGDYSPEYSVTAAQ